MQGTEEVEGYDGFKELPEVMLVEDNFCSVEPDEVMEENERHLRLIADL